MASIYQSIEILSKEKGIDPQIVVDAVKDEATAVANPVAGKPFDVALHSEDAFGNVVPVRQATTVMLSVKSGSGTGVLSGTLTATAQPGQSLWTIAGAVYSKSENGVTLVASVTGGDTIQPAQATVNVQAVVAVVLGTPGTAATLGSSACSEPTRALPTCATTFFQHGVNGLAQLSEGSCAGVATGCLTNQSVTSLNINVTANLNDANGNPLYSRTDPVATIVECDQSLCTGGGVTNYHLFVDIAGTGTYVQAAACPSKGTIAATGVPFCVDYFRSHREGDDRDDGDLELYLLWDIDYGVHY